MGVHSGKFGVVNGVDTVRNWSISEQQMPARAIASNTKFGPARRKGVFSWTGSYEKYGGQPLHFPGDVFAFLGFTAPDTDVAATAGIVYDGDAMVDSVAIRWNWTTGAIIDQVVNFSGHLDLARTSSTMADATTPDLQEITNAKIHWVTGVTADFTAPIILPNISSATLTLSASNQPYVNSSTIISSKLWTGRKAGPIDATIAITVQDNVRGLTGIPDIGDDIKLRLYINATEFWEIWWGHVRDYTGLTVDRETAAILQATVNIDFNGYHTTGGEGKIIDPAAATWWPPAASLLLPEDLQTAEVREPTEAEQAELARQEELLANSPEGTFVRSDPRIIVPGMNATEEQVALIEQMGRDRMAEDLARAAETSAEVEPKPYVGHRSFEATQPPERVAVAREALANPSGGEVPQPVEGAAPAAPRRPVQSPKPIARASVPRKPVQAPRPVEPAPPKDAGGQADAGPRSE